MAGMNLNPYNLNNNNNNNPNNNKKMFSNHYSGDKNYNSDEPIGKIEEEPNQYLKAYGFRTTNPNDIDLNKKIEQPKNNNKYIVPIVIFAIAILVIIIAILL
jgi:hypothetical protein